MQFTEIMSSVKKTLLLLCATLLLSVTVTMAIAEAQEMTQKQIVMDFLMFDDEGGEIMPIEEAEELTEDIITRAKSEGVDIEDTVELLGFAQEVLEEYMFTDDFYGDSFVSGNVNCFDYYKFGSVQANISVPVTGFVSGTIATFSGYLTNNNPYPIVDGALYVKVFKKRDEEGGNANGPLVVDQAFVKTGITIPANKSIPISFQWQVPSYAVSGEYMLATFFTTSKKFNLLGLSFTDDVVGNTISFNITGEQEGTVLFDKDAVAINGDPYTFAAFPPRVSATDPVSVTAVVVNETYKAVRVPIRWRLFYWDAQRRENMIDEKVEEVTIEKNGTATVVYNAEDANYPVYLLEGVLKYEDTKSIINVRFVRDGIDRIRLNFPGVTDYPLRAGEETALFSCLHNTSYYTAKNGRLELSLKDTNGEIIREYVYEGSVTGEMMGVADTFVPSKTYTDFTLEARLFDNDTLVDDVVLEYNCKDIAPELCKLSLNDDISNTELSQNVFTATGWELSLLVFVVLFALVILVYIWKMSRDR